MKHSRRNFSSVLAGLVLGLGGSPGSTSPLPAPAAPLEIPRGQAVLVDGTIVPEEWADARVLRLGEERSLRVKHDGESLFLAIRGEGQAIASVQVRVGEEEVRLLHASAALGTIGYRAAGEAWALETRPDWKCRGADESEEAAAEREAFLEAQGWLASNVYQGEAAELEFQLALERFAPEGSLTLVVSVLPMQANDGTWAWPADVEDDSVSRTLVAGPFPDEARFETDTWGRWTLSEERLEELETE